MYDTIPHYVLKFLRRKLYPKFFTSYHKPAVTCEENLDDVNQMISEKLESDDSCMIARFGAFELSVCSNYEYIKRGKPSLIKYIQGYGGEWWWNNRTLSQMTSNAGFWPATHENAAKFAELYIECCRQIDILGSWLPEEKLFEEQLSNASKVHLFALEPFFSKHPWTRSLAGKKVLVIHPFVETIKNQYKKHLKLFYNKDILPLFELSVYQSVQSMGGGFRL